MKMKDTDVVFFSPSTNGAYTVEINGNDIPKDAVEIPKSDWTSLLEQLGGSAKKIAAGADGLPILIDPPLPSTDEIEAMERTWRDVRLAETDALVTRHRDELEEDGSKTTLTTKQYTELQAYRRELRNWPDNGDFPLSEHRPEAPEWLARLTQQ